jgi:hypothetical protein
MSQLKELEQLLVHFLYERDWKQFHIPKDFVVALSIEAKNDENWIQNEVILKPKTNLTEFSDIVLLGDEEQSLKVVGFFDRVLEIKEGQIQLLNKNNVEYPEKEAFYKVSMIVLSENLKSSQ